MSEPDAYLDDDGDDGDVILVTADKDPESCSRQAISSLDRTGEVSLVGAGYEESTQAMAEGWDIVDSSGSGKMKRYIIDSIGIGGVVLNVMPVTDEGVRRCVEVNMMDLKSDTRLEIDEGVEGYGALVYKTAVPVLNVGLKDVKKMIERGDGDTARAMAKDVLLPHDHVGTGRDVVYMDGMDYEDWYGPSRVEAWQKINKFGRVFIQGYEDGIGRAILIAASMVDGKSGSTGDVGRFEALPKVMLGDIRCNCLDEDEGWGMILEVELVQPAILEGRT